MPGNGYTREQVIKARDNALAAGDRNAVAKLNNYLTEMGPREGYSDPSSDEVANFKFGEQPSVGQNPKQTQGQPGKPSGDPTLWDRFQYGVDAPLEGIADTAKFLGQEGAEEALRGLTEPPSEDYEPAGEKFDANPDKAWWNPARYDWSYADDVTAESAGSFAGSIAARGAGAAAGGAVGGPVGATVGAVGGPAVFGALQVLGPILNERLANDGREGQDPTYDDWMYAIGAASASGALDAAAPNMGRFLSRVLVEGGTEGLQSVVEQSAGSADTEAGLTVSGGQAVTEAVGGAGAAGAVTGAGRAAQAAGSVLPSRTDADISDDDVRLADRLVRAADGDPSRLSDVDSRRGQEIAKAVLDEIRAESAAIVGDLRKFLKSKNDREALIAVNSVKKGLGNMNSEVPSTHIDTMVERASAYPEIAPDIERFQSLAHQGDRLQQFTRGEGDLGGLSKRLTRYMDLSDPRNPRIGKGAVIAGALGGGAVGGIPISAGALVGATAVNRMVRGLDRVTNQRSRIKRFVDSSRASGRKPSEIAGEAVGQVIQRQRAEEAARKLAEQDQSRQERDALKERQLALRERAQAFREREADRRRQEREEARKVTQQERLAKNSKVTQKIEKNRAANEAAVRKMFEDNKVPEDLQYFEPYRLWTAATGAGPRDIAMAMAEMAKQGDIPRDVVERFLTDVRSFSADPNVYTYQELVRQRINPDYRPDPDAFNKKVQPVKKSTLDRSKAASRTATPGNRRKSKAMEGERVVNELRDMIEDPDYGLKESEIAALYDLVARVDRPDMTRDARAQLVDDTLSQIFKRKTDQRVWRTRFGKLISIGNDYSINRGDDEAEAIKETRTKRRARGRKRAEKPSPEADAGTGAAARRNALRAPQSASETGEEGPAAPRTPEEPTAPPEGSQSLSEPPTNSGAQVDEAPSQKPERKGNRTGLAGRYRKALEAWDEWKVKAEEGGERLAQRVTALQTAKSAGDVKAVIELEILSSPTQPTQNRVTMAVAKHLEVAPEEAAEYTNRLLKEMEDAGVITRRQNKNNRYMMKDGKFVKTTDGKNVEVVMIEPASDSLKELSDIAEAVRKVSNLPETASPHEPFGPGRNYIDGFMAIEEYPNAGEEFRPFYGFLNAMRQQPVVIDRKVMDQIESALDKSNGQKRQGTIADVLVPKEKERNPETGRLNSLSEDLSPLRAVSQLRHQIEENGSNLLFQEWKGDRRLRTYALNSNATSQGGDLMKGLVRAQTAAPVDTGGADWLFHAFGNLLGYDKEAPSVRRNIIFEGENIDNLLTFAENPFKRNLLTSEKTKKPTAIGNLVKESEGFFQALSVANELKRMVDWARERNPGLSRLSPKDLLQRPEVQESLADYETDFLVQLDANNNSFQLVGLMLGDESILQATGMLPQQGVTDPDNERGADVYTEPAVAVTSRVPELEAIGLPRKTLRKLFKKSISNFVYASTFQSRRKAMEDELETIRKNYGFDSIFSTDETVGLIKIPDAVQQGLKSKEGYTFTKHSFDPETGEANAVEYVRRRVVKDGDKWVIEKDESKKGQGKLKKQKRKYATEDEAITAAFGQDFFGRVNRELVREINTRYPSIQEFINFSLTVSKIAKDRGQDTIAVPTRDGINLEYQFKENEVYAPAPVELGNRTVRLGLPTEDSSLAGRGLAAFMTHQQDAWVMREAYKRLMGEKPLIHYNPIHDSHGFHPSDATRGQQKVLEVMQEIGDPNYNIFVEVLEANGISMEEFMEAGGVMPNRKPVPKADTRQIPTAVS